MEPARAAGPCLGARSASAGLCVARPASLVSEQLIKSDEMHRRTEQGESLIPWLADSQVTLDKYDCR